jgi:3-methyladenine DNA glycosylase/8-oxoguanine DNA glycosylase
MYHRAKLHFKKADPILYQAARLHHIADICRSRNVFRDIVQTIVNQQLSGKAAETIFGRLEAKVKARAGHASITAASIAVLSIPTLRACGLSNAKATTIKALACAVLGRTPGTPRKSAEAAHKLDLAIIHTHPDDKVIELLTSIKGIGPWTAEMILMSSLGRTDIFSYGDLGLKKGIMHLYDLSKLPSDRLMEKLARAWSPYRTYAAKVLWRVADGKKVKRKEK